MMKKLLIIALLVTANILKAQDIKSIEFSFKSKKLISPDSLEEIEEGDYYQIKIGSINLNLYKISLNSSDTTLYKPLQISNFGSLDLDVITKAVTGLSPLTTLVSDLTQQHSVLKNFSTQSNVIEDFISKKQTDEIDILSSYLKKITNLSNNINNFKLDISIFRISAIENEYDNSCSIDFKSKLDEVRNISQDLKQLQMNVIDSKLSYELFSTRNKKEISANPNYEIQDKSINEVYDKFVTVLSEAQSSINTDKVNDLLVSLVSLQYNSDNMFTSLPIRRRGDQTAIELTITPRNSDHLQVYKTKIFFPFNQKNYAALGLSFYATSLHDDSYSVEKTTINDTVSIYKIVKESSRNFEFGITSLLRIGCKFKNGGGLGGHLNLGPGISITKNIKPRLLFGGGFTYGNKNMIAIDIGFIGGFVDRLSSAISLDGSYSAKPENIAVSKISTGFYISIGYTFFSF